MLTPSWFELKIGTIYLPERPWNYKPLFCFKSTCYHHAFTIPMYPFSLSLMAPLLFSLFFFPPLVTCIYFLLARLSTHCPFLVCLFLQAMCVIIIYHIPQKNDSFQYSILISLLMYSAKFLHVYVYCCMIWQFIFHTVKFAAGDISRYIPT